MKNIIKHFVKYPVLGNSIAVMAILFGLLAFINIKTTFFPPVPSKTITIQAMYPGASPEEIEEGITLKVEDNIKGLTGIDRVTSISRENSANITVELLSGYDINEVLQDVKNAVDQVSTFPVGMDKITVYREEPMNFAVSVVLSGDVELKTLKTYARRIERDLLATDGISKVTLSGFPNEEIEIAFRENDLRAYGLTFEEAANAISNENIKTTGGTIKGKAEEFLIRANTKTYYAEELKNLVLKATDNGTIIRIKDVADVTDKWTEDPNKVYYNGDPAVMISVSNTNEEDLFEVADIVKNYANDFNEKTPDVKANVLRDGSQIIQERIDILSSNGLLGMILVVLFLSLALNPRLSLWVALGIPISFMGMLVAGTAYGLTLNVMSLMSMILVLGILVDDGIVIAENIFQHYERGEKPITAAINGTIEVLPSVVSSILTTVVIFVTFFFLEGRMGDSAKDIAFVVIATLLFSLVEAILILPAHIAHSKALHGKDKTENIILRKAEETIMWLKGKVYAPVLKFSLDNPLIAFAIPIALFIITIGALNGSIIKTTFFPNIEHSFLSISLEMPAGTPAAVTDSILAEMEKPVKIVNERYKSQNPEKGDLITAISRRVSAINKGTLSLVLKSSEERELSSLQIAELIRKEVGEIKDAENLEIGGSANFGKPISVALSGNNLEELEAAKIKLKSELKKIAKLKDVVDDNPPGEREVKVQLKEKAYALGLTTAEVMRQVRSGFFGSEAQRLIRGIDEVRIYVRYNLDDRSSLNKLEDMRIRTSDGGEYPLKDIADFTIVHGVVSINHTDQQRVVNVSADIADPNDSVTDIIADINAEVMPAIIKEFPEITFSYEGQNRESNKTTNAMASIIPGILLLMFLIIVVTFRSFLQAIIIFILIPFSLIGVFWGHYFQGFILSMLSTFGVIALIGIVVNDSLVFTEAFNRSIRKGMKLKEALFETGMTRFRAVLLTSITTIAGLAPLIFSKSHQAQFLSPMAVSVAYGLLFGTVLTLVLLPTLILIVNKIRRILSKIFRQVTLSPEQVEPAIIEMNFVKQNEDVTK
ncbi:MAG: efflux RND transporter permease subunit [Ignavibacteria bacterium]|jgi:multidrug efflux pump subunit AcrB